MSKAAAILFLALAPGTCRAVYSTSTDAALRVPVGARAAGLGGAFTGVADDATAVFWNPAGLSQGGLAFQSMTMAVSYAALPFDRRAGFLALSKSVPDRGVFALALVHATVGRIPKVESDGAVSGALSDAEDTLSFSVSYRKTPNLALGTSVSASTAQLGPYRAVGASLSFGAYWQPTFERPYFLGVALDRLGSYRSWNTGALDNAPPSLRVGQSMLFSKDRVRASLDAEATGAAGLRAPSDAGRLQHRAALTGKF